MGFVGEASERLERPHSLICGLLEIAAKQRAIDVTLESFCERIGDGPRDELDVEVEAGRAKKALECVHCGVRLTALDSSDNRLDGSGARGQLSLAKGSPDSSLADQRSHPDAFHDIMISNNISWR
jgi:hypothetical protein